jgi:hypothetical protein
MAPLTAFCWECRLPSKDVRIHVLMVSGNFFSFLFFFGNDKNVHIIINKAR